MNEHRKKAAAQTKIGYYAYGLGGVGRYVTSLILGIDKRQFECSSVYLNCPPCPDRDDFEKQMKNEGISIIDLDLEGFPARKNILNLQKKYSTPSHNTEKKQIIKKRFLDLVPQNIKLWNFYIKGIIRGRNEFSRANLDILHINLGNFPMLLPAVFAAILSSVKKIVITVHLLDGCSDQKMRFLDGVLLWLIAKSRVRIIAISDIMRRQLIQRYGFKADRIVRIYNGVDIEKFKPEEPSEAVQLEIGNTEQRIIFLIPARLSWVKGHAVLFDAIASKKNDFQKSLFLLAGDGPLTEDLMDSARKKGIEHLVSFLGFRTDIPDLTKFSDVVVLSSHNEAFPFSILEAMATAKPVVATAVGAVEEMVDQKKTGTIIPPNNPRELANALLEMIEIGKSRRDEMGNAGRSRVIEFFSLDQMIRNTVDLYD